MLQIILLKLLASFISILAAASCMYIIKDYFNSLPPETEDNTHDVK